MRHKPRAGVVRQRGRQQELLHVRGAGELAFEAVPAALGCIPGEAQLVVPFLAIGNVAQERTEEEPVFAANRGGDRELDGKLPSGSVQGRELEPTVQHRRFARRMKPAQALEMRASKSGRDDRVGKLAPDHFGRRPAECDSGLRVPVGNPARFVDADEGIVRGVHDEVGARFAAGQALDRVAALFMRDLDRDQIRDGEGEVLFVNRPRPGLADVLGA